MNEILSSYDKAVYLKKFFVESHWADCFPKKTLFAILSLLNNSDDNDIIIDIIYHRQITSSIDQFIDDCTRYAEFINE